MNSSARMSCGKRDCRITGDTIPSASSLPNRLYAAGAAPGSAIDEFKTLVRELHRSGIEVILDVVYNHTAEGNECGPTLSFKGLDNKSYYSLCGDESAPLRYYRNYFGTGNPTASSPLVNRLVLDSLRYWAEVMHVDGFRFDLAACLGRDRERRILGLQPSCSRAIAADPVLGKLKLIAEPWDMEA